MLGRTLDGLLQQLLDYILRDFINCYLNQYSYQSQSLSSTIKYVYIWLLFNRYSFISIFIREDLWGAVQILHERLTRIDHAKLIACDLVIEVTNHFEMIREAQALR